MNNKRHLLIYGVTRLDDMIHKGNVWYLRNYEAAFDQVTALYLTGGENKVYQQGLTTLISSNIKQKPFLHDLLTSPLNLYNTVKRLKPTHVVTADILFSFWTSILLKLLGVKHILMPVCLVNEIYPDRKPYFLKRKWLEKLFMNLSFVSADKILLAKHYRALNEFFSKHKLTKKKIIFSDVIIEEFPDPDFYSSIIQKFKRPEEYRATDTNVLLYVGRLHVEKCPFDLIRMMKVLKNDHRKFQLVCIGGGDKLPEVKQLAENLGVSQDITFIDNIKNSYLVPYYQHADIVVSPFTGTALREAVLCRKIVVSYRHAISEAAIEHLESGYLTDKNTPEELAKGVLQMLDCEHMHDKMKLKIIEIGKRWDRSNVKSSLETIFK